MSITATNSNEFRKNFKKYSDDVTNYNDVVIVTRPKNKNIVVISEAEYNSLKETEYLLHDKENRSFLRESLKQLERGDSKSYSIDEWKKINSQI